MRKIIILLVLIISIICVNVKAECNEDYIKELQTQISDIDINIEYLGIDEYGVYSDEGYMLVYIKNLPQHFMAFIGSENNSYNLVDNKAPLIGGVYTVSFYHNECEDQLVKSYQIKVPYYKQYSIATKKNNNWFDGTYENKVYDPNETENKLNIWLIVILIILVGIIGSVVYLWFTKWRRKKI